LKTVNILIAGLLVVGTTMTANAQTMEKGAFLNKPVFSTKELLKQVDQDPQVAKRFSKHFMMDKNQLKRVFSGLTLKQLPVTRRYEVYNVDSKLKVGKKKLLFKKGTLAFVDRTGKPILKRSCGNPMAVVPPVGLTAGITTEIKPVELATVAPEEVYASATEPEMSIIDTAITPDLPAVETAEEVTSVTESMIEPVASPIIPVAAAAGLSPWLGILAIPPLLIRPGGGGGNTPPVPEPASLLVLAGAAAFIRRRQKS
jgi:hypothetical protein